MNEVGIGNASAQLLSSGDRFEKLLAADQALSSLAQAYAQFWANHVFPGRLPGNPAFVNKEIREIAERSYTALVRFLIAVEAARKIEETCLAILARPDDDRAVLTLHAELFVFFSSAGVAVELLMEAFTLPPISAGDKLFEAPDDEWGSPNWFYKRRHDLVHHRLVPIAIKDDLPSIDVGTFSGKNAPWGKTPGDVRELSSLIRELSMHLMTGLQRAWFKMSGRLHSPGGVTVTELPIRITSGIS